MKNRIVCLLLALAMGSSFASCTGDNDTPVDTDAPVTDNNETAGGFTESRESVADGLDDYEGMFEGYEYRVAVSEANHKFVDVEDDMRDVVDRAVYNRNLAVEERFGCEIVIEHQAEKWYDSEAYIRNSVLAQEDLFDIAAHHVVSLGNLVLQDYFTNWYDVPGVDFSKPWWSSCTTETLSYDGVCLIAIGDFALSSLSNAYCVFYNKVDAETYQLPNLYEVVNNGEWTFDYVLELTKDIYDDTNRNEKVDDDDYFGYISDAYSNIDAYLWAFDNPVLEVNNNGIELVYKTEKLVDIVTKLVDATSSGAIRINKDYKNSTGSSHNYGIETFAKGHALFSNGYIGQSLVYLRDMTDDYGILPYPKWNEEQTEYYTMSDGNHTALAVPRTVPGDRLEFVGVITEALCAETYKKLVPAYYEEALKLKGSRDDESMEMIDRITSSVVFDLGYIFDGANGCARYLEKFVQGENSNFESFWASRSNVVKTHYDGVVEYFENYNS